MAARDILSAAAGAAKGRLYVDDVFSTYLYTGNGSTQTINNGIDLAGEGGMVWLKNRLTTDVHILQDTDRGANKVLRTNTTDAEATIATYNFAFLNNGFSMNTGAGVINQAPQPYASWTFRKAPKFFDIVTYTGNGVAGRQIPHELGIAPGMVIVKRTDSASNWFVLHRGDGTNAYGLALNSTGAGFTPPAGSTWGDNVSYIPPTLSAFYVGTSCNAAGGQYVAYLFAHDPSADGIIQCGSYIGNGSNTGPVVDLGWEPQYLIIKNSSNVGQWMLLDIMRGIPTDGIDSSLYADASTAENSGGANYIDINSSGFSPKTTNGVVNSSGSNYIYLAIRRPNKPPTSGTEVYNAIARTGTSGGKVTSGILTDAVIIRRKNATSDFYIYDRLRGSGRDLKTNLTNTEAGTYTMALDQQDGYVPQSAIPINYTGTYPYIDYAFRRAPGFFDVVCYTGTGVARTVPHSLGVAPELVITKSRSVTGAWGVLPIDATQYLSLSSTNAQVASVPSWNNTQPTASVFSLGTSAGTNGSGNTMVAYLFASIPGISKVGSYTGNGSSQTINCSFSTGARFVLIKRTDSTGNWYVWDTARGIVSANDPHLSLNTTVAEVTTDDSVDPDTTGFIVNQVAATNINVTSATYIYLAIA